MKKRKKLIILILIIGVLFISVGCSSNQYSQEDIDILKLYSTAIYVYDDLDWLNDVTMLDLNSVYDLVGYLDEYNTNPKFLDEYLNNIKSQRENFNGKLKKVTDLIMLDLNKSIDMSDMLLIVDNLDKTIDYLDDTYIKLKQYSETGDYTYYHTTEILTGANIYTDFLLDNYSNSMQRKAELFVKIRDYSNASN